METRLQNKPKRRSHLNQTSYRSLKDNPLFEAKQQPMCHTFQTKHTVKHILIKCTDQAHIRETFYSSNDMKEVLQNIEIKKFNIIPKSDKYMRNNLNEISTGPNFSYKQFLY